MIENGVLLGQDGWLFLVGGSNNVQHLFFESDSISLADVQAWNLLLTERETRLRSMGIQYLHICVPDKLLVYRDKWPLDITSISRSPSQFIYGHSSLADCRHIIVDILPAMLEAKKDSDVFWKTDTHWTFAGASAAHRVICEKLNATIPNYLIGLPVQEISLCLDLGSKLTPQRREMWGAPQVLRNAKQIYKNPLVRFLELLSPRHQGDMHTGASVGFLNNAEVTDRRRVLIVGDSYCEYRPHSLTGLLAETFKETRFIWSNALDYSLIEKFKPDVVVTEIAERFIKRVPIDDVDTETFAYEKIAAFINRNCSEHTSPQFRYEHPL